MKKARQNRIPMQWKMMPKIKPLYMVGAIKVIDVR
jgi:hypothetical protein